MSLRRNLLLSQLANAFKWLPYSFEYLYNSLIPQTISGKNVKNKARIKKIYGNSAVVNQLVQNGNFESSTGWNAVRGDLVVNNNSATISCNTANTGWGVYKNIGITFNTNHKYLICFDVNLNSSSTEVYGSLGGGNNELFATPIQNKLIRVAHIYTNVGTGNTNITIYGRNGAGTIGDTMKLENVQLIDLTQEYPFDAPTTLTDNRVQNILNGGYIPYNTGEIKDTIISEIESEPYNLFDGVLEHGTISNNGTLGNNSDYVRTPTYIEVLPNISYTIETTRANTRVDVFQYDSEHNFILRNANINGTSFTMENNTKYIKFRALDSRDSSITIPLDLPICFHRTGTRTGYAPYTTPSKITLPAPVSVSGVGTSQDTFAITKTAYEWTRNNWEYTFDGSETWTLEGDYGKYYAPMNISVYAKGIASSLVGNLLCDKYATVPQATMSSNDKTVSIGVSDNTKTVCVRDTANITSSATAQSVMTGKTVKFQLATPQVINIPRKHLGVVKINQLTFEYRGDLQSGCFVSNSLSSFNAKGGDNYYIVSFLNGGQTSYGSLANMSMRIATSTQMAMIDKSCSTVQQFLDKHGNEYLFYETENEVADIDFEIDVEAGGTITSDSDVLPNVDFDYKCK